MLDEVDHQHVTERGKTARIGWWNTHLSPPRGKSLPDTETDLVLEVIALLLTECDVVFLGEVSPKDLAWLTEQLAGTPFIVSDMAVSGKSKFHLGMIHKEVSASLVRTEFSSKSIGGNTYKISCRVDLVIHENDIFSFLVSHWPSRLLKPEDAAVRGHYGAALRRNVEELQKDKIDYIIALGDYNDEPFNESMTTYLRGSRDASSVMDNPDLLYNPFWKQITCQRGYIRHPELSDHTGTYFHRGDKLHRWKVLDQMLFSASFVGKGTWHLNENGTGVFRHENLIEAVKSSKFQLDHLPIVAEITKESTNG